MAAYDLIVIGAGPGGYVAAIRGAQLGMKVACIEAEERLGGTCLRIGCIPSKALLESTEKVAEARHGLAAHGIRVAGVEVDLAAMHARKDAVVDGLTKGVDALFRKNGVTRVRGRARIAGPGRIAVEGGEALEGKHVILATGSKVAMLPGVELDGDRIGTSTEALAWPEAPERLVVIGAGAIGLELGSVWARLGSKVTVLEYLDRILPEVDAEIARDAQRILGRQGLVFRLGVRVTAARAAGRRCVVELAGGETVEADRVLLATGRAPNTDGLGVEAVGIRLDRKGRIEVDDAFRTSAPGFHAIGDVIPGPMLAHKAADEGIACVERIATGFGHVNPDAIPSIVYTNPEVAWVGRGAEALAAAGIEFRAGTFAFRGNGRARALAQVDGRVKVLADARTDRVLGVHVAGPRAGDLIAEAAVAIEFGASAEDIARAPHAHPTLAETLREAALAVSGSAIHS